jgi:vesicle coat complex subunit
MNGKSQYEKDFKYFYCKNDEPTYIKNIKVNILGMLANEYNLGDMLNELNEYANDVDVEIAVKSVQVLADIALRLPDVSKALMINLMSFYNTEQEHLVNSSVVCFYRLLRKYPKLFSEIKPHLLHCHHLINET